MADIFKERDEVLMSCMAEIGNLKNKRFVPSLDQIKVGGQLYLTTTSLCLQRH